MRAGIEHLEKVPSANQQTQTLKERDMKERFFSSFGPALLNWWDFV